MVRGRRGEAVGVEKGADFLGRLAEIAGEFEFFVADFGDARDGAVEVLLHEAADGVELQAYAIDVMDSSGGPCWAGDGADNGGGDG